MFSQNANRKQGIISSRRGWQVCFVVLLSKENNHKTGPLADAFSGRLAGPGSHKHGPPASSADTWSPCFRQIPCRAKIAVLSVCDLDWSVKHGHEPGLNWTLSCPCLIQLRRADYFSCGSSRWIKVWSCLPVGQWLFCGRNHGTQQSHQQRGHQADQAIPAGDGQ